jgi:hypothetical protein
MQITFLGLCFVFANIGTLLAFDPNYEGKVLPSWVYLSWALGLFAYQSESVWTTSKMESRKGAVLWGREGERLSEQLWCEREMLRMEWRRGARYCVDQLHTREL